MANSYRDWEDIGDTIQNLIDQAINSRDYQKLNQTVIQTVGRAVDMGSDAIRRAVEQERRNAKRPPVSNSRPKVVDAVDSRPEPSNLPVLYRDTTGKMLAGIFKTIGGSLLSGGTGLTLLVTALLHAFMGGGSVTLPIVMSMLGFGGGVYLIGDGISTMTRVKRFEKYVRMLGKKTHFDLEKLARALGKPVSTVKKDLRKMIHDGMFLEGHFDAEETCLITSNETYRLYEDSRKQLEQRRQQERLEARFKPAPKAVSPQVQEVLDRGNAFLLQIRSCNEAIPGEEISTKIYRMELIVQRIFERAEAHPEIVPDLKKLMDYYLPMTVKLLNAYADMDKQPVQGETIISSKREIEATLDTLNLAFEKLLDSVFRETALDVSSDISVLQTLLAQEGLTGDDFQLK